MNLRCHLVLGEIRSGRRPDVLDLKLDVIDREVVNCIWFGIELADRSLLHLFNDVFLEVAEFLVIERLNGFFRKFQMLFVRNNERSPALA